MIKCNLAILMAERKLSIQDVADKTGLSRTTISALVNENGKGIQFETMDSLCRLLRVRPGDLFSFTTYEVKTKIINWEHNGPQIGTFMDLRGNVTEKVFEKAYRVEVNIQIQQDLKFVNENIALQVNLEFDSKNQVSDVHIEQFVKIYRLVQNYVDDSISELRGKEVFQAVENEIISYIENDLSLKISPNANIHK